MGITKTDHFLQGFTLSGAAASAVLSLHLKLFVPCLGTVIRLTTSSARSRNTLLRLLNDTFVGAYSNPGTQRTVFLPGYAKVYDVPLLVPAVNKNGYRSASTSQESEYVDVSFVFLVLQVNIREERQGRLCMGFSARVPRRFRRLAKADCVGDTKVSTTGPFCQSTSFILTLRLLRL